MCHVGHLTAVLQVLWAQALHGICLAPSSRHTSRAPGGSDRCSSRHRLPPIGCLLLLQHSIGILSHASPAAVGMQMRQACNRILIPMAADCASEARCQRLATALDTFASAAASSSKSIMVLPPTLHRAPSTLCWAGACCAHLYDSPQGLPKP